MERKRPFAGLIDWFTERVGSNFFVGMGLLLWP